jgi:hypothetical protein
MNGIAHFWRRTKENETYYYLGQSKSSESDILIRHSTLRKPFFLDGLIEKTMLFLSVLFDRYSTVSIVLKFR